VRAGSVCGSPVDLIGSGEVGGATSLISVCAQD
jgi:hypothetical protein